MARIIPLETPDNVTLIGGASQYWNDRPRPLLDIDWSDVLVPQVAGRTLVVGWAPESTLQALAEAADELHVLERGALGAAQAGTAVESAQVWCGDPRALAEIVEGFDTVLCLADTSRVLPLESEARTWREVVDDVLALAKPEATVVFWVENDLGIHRITANHNPRAERSDDDWNVMATFDESRPLTLDAVRDEFEGADVRLTWPSRQWNLLVDADSADPAMHAALAQRAALAPVNGPDPAYILQTANRAGRLTDYASGWLVVRNPRVELGAPIQFADRFGVQALEHAVPADARSASSVFAELTASQDIPAVRRFIADWSDTYADPGAGSAAFPLNAVRRVGEGYEFVALAASKPGTADQLRWQALGELVAILRSRNWRHLWPANYTDARILNHLGIMAGLHTVSPARAERLIPPAPDASEGFIGHDMQSLVAAIDRNNETISSLRSEVALTKYELEQAQTPKGLLRKPAKALGIVKRTIRGALR